ncbi:hypothetical protein [Chitinophaga filiformis]|uniref:hypothetical protein n=1 Tax=Chitinophaga filiformis TaxID=104663 RepID=UPI000B7DCA8F|nr:hypothetical protein [Chitinophaga filiformis]
MIKPDSKYRKGGQPGISHLKNPSGAGKRYLQKSAQLLRLIKPDSKYRKGVQPGISHLKNPSGAGKHIRNTTKKQIATKQNSQRKQIKTFRNHKLIKLANPQSDLVKNYKTESVLYPEFIPILKNHSHSS